jgi:hypothetical protein
VDPVPGPLLRKSGSTRHTMSLTKTNQLMLFREIMFVVGIIKHKYSVWAKCKMFIILKDVVHMDTTVL